MTDLTSRKSDHIKMSADSVPDTRINLGKTTYEPLLNPHPTRDSDIGQIFLGYRFGMPLWISSMTGGTDHANRINHNLAKACGEFGLGMGLGSCRPLLESDDRFADFDVKGLMGESPLFANFGIAQLEQLIEADALNKVTDILKKLQADGLVIHVNPLQEWAQAEGDRYKKPALETIRTVCDSLDTQIIVKEVGQGMGPQSLKALLALPIAAIELAAFGGTNFSLLEHRRAKGDSHDNTPAESFAYIGHTAGDMIQYLNVLHAQSPTDKDIIISGGVKDPLSGHILRQSCALNSVIGMASGVLKHAMGDYDDLRAYLIEVKECLAMAQAFVIKAD